MKQRRRQGERNRKASNMASKFLLSPSDTGLAEKLGDDAINSSLPESKGADVLLYTESGLLGWQRKAVPNDFISSFTDGRFARLLPLLTKSCAFCRIVQEGEFKYWPDQTVHLGMRIEKGRRVRVQSRFTRNHIHGMLNDIEVVWGVPIRVTEDLDDTVRYLRSVRRFMEAKTHVGLYTRPKVKGRWYVPSADEVQLWILQGFGGIGPSTADKIIRHFGRIPLRWTCSVEELAGVEGVTHKQAQELISVLSAIPKHSIDKEAQVRDMLRAEGEFDSLRRVLGRGM